MSLTTSTQILEFAADFATESCCAMKDLKDNAEYGQNPKSVLALVDMLTKSSLLCDVSVFMELGPC